MHQLGSITTDQVYLELTFLTLAMLVVGGLTSLWGAVVGALAVSGLDSFLSQAENGVHVARPPSSTCPPGTRLVILASIMALVLILRPSGLTGGRELAAAAAAEARVRVCIVGCGAVGSLFAANLANLDDVEVWAYDLSREHVDAINANGLRLSGAGEVVGQVRATTDAAELPRVRLRDRRDEGDAHRARDRGDRGTRSPTARSASVQNGIGNEEALAAHVAARDPRDDLPGRPDPRARTRAVGREGRHDDRAVRAEPCRGLEEIERLAEACTRAGLPTDGSRRRAAGRSGAR